MYLKKIGVCDNNIYERLSNAWDRYTLLKGEICAKNCPIGAIAVEPGADGKKVVSITNMCVECNVCRRVCPFGAIDGAEKTEGMVQCHSCSIQCKVPVGSTGACKRYTNEGGRLVRNRALVVEGKPQIEIDPRIAKPVITAVGAGTNYPCIRPAPALTSSPPSLRLR